MTTNVKHALLSLAILAGAFTAQAQVKIGTNPTTIGASSNLEVEATNNKKVIVDKAVGTVQVENLPSGAVTDSIVTAHPATGVLRRVNSDKLASILFAQTSSMSFNKTLASPGPFQLVYGGGVIKINFTDTDFDKLGAVDIVNGRLKVPKEGYYTYNVRTRVSTAQSYHSYDIFVLKNFPTGSPNPLSNYFDRATGSATGSVSTLEFSNTVYLMANDYLDIYLGPCANCGGNGPYNMNSVRFSIQYLGK